MTFVSDDAGFALGSVGCGTGRCAALLGTTDGGTALAPSDPADAGARRRLQHLPARPPVRAGGAVRHPADRLRVLARLADDDRRRPALAPAEDDRRDVTGGGRRHGRARRGRVRGLCGRPLPGRVRGRRKQLLAALAAPAIETICPPVLYRQGSRIVLAGYGNAAGGVRATAQIDRSADSGRTWASGPDSCGGKDGYASTLALAPPSTLVLLCKHQMPRHTAPSAQPGSASPPTAALPSGPTSTFRCCRSPPGEQSPTTSSPPPARPACWQWRPAPKGSRLLRSGNGGRSWTTSLRFPGGGHRSAGRIRGPADRPRRPG